MASKVAILAPRLLGLELFKIALPTDIAYQPTCQVTWALEWHHFRIISKAALMDLGTLPLRVAQATYTYARNGSRTYQEAFSAVDYFLTSLSAGHTGQH